MIYFSFDFALLARVKYPLDFGTIVSKKDLSKKTQEVFLFAKNFLKLLNQLPGLTKTEYLPRPFTVWAN